MRYPASEKLEIIRIVEQSHLPTKITLDKRGVARQTFYRWYDRYLEGGPETLADQPSAPSRVWNRIPTVIHDQIIDLAVERSGLSSKELAVQFTDTLDIALTASGCNHARVQHKPRCSATMAQLYRP